VYGDISFLYGQNVSKKEPLRRIPPVHGRAGLKYFVNPDLEFSLEYLFAGSQERLSGGDISDDRIPEGGTPGWRVLNVYGYYSLDPFTIMLSFRNLLDEKYKYHGSGIYMAGRSAWISVVLSI
jgi:outer membrane receptor protein involved in Fe transport